MARFKYLGEPPRPYVAAYGPCEKLKVPSTTGVQELLPVAPLTAFAIGADIGHDVTDALSLVVFRADTGRFEEIV